MIEWVPLDDVAKVDRTAASTQQAATMPYVGLEHIEADTGALVDGYSPVAGDVKATKFLFTPQHILYSKLRPYLNKRLRPTFDGVCSTEILPILPKAGIADRYYLFHYMGTKKFVEWASDNVSGANLPRLSPSLLAEAMIPYRPLPQQQAIAQRLERADRLRRLRQHALDISDQYLQTVFLEMFGNPETNPKGWERAEIGEVIALSQYGTSQKSNSEGLGYPVIGMNHVTYSGRLEVNGYSHVQLNRTDFENLRLRRGDVLFNRTNSTDLVGKTAVWNLDLDAVPASYLIRIKLKDPVTPEFFAALLNTSHFKRLFVDRCKRAVSQSNISPTLLKEFVIYLPPRPMQDAFSSVVHKHERLRAMQVEALRQADLLYEMLLEEAFRN